MESLRTEPVSREAEQSVLGGLIIDNSALDQTVEVIQPADFHDPHHRLIFNAILRLSEAGHPIDIITISEELDRDGDLKTVGGLAYLAEIATSTPSADNQLAYARIVREHADLRRLIQASRVTTDDGFNPAGRSVAELLQQAEQRLQALSDTHTSSGFESINPMLKRTIQLIENPLKGLPSGLYALDEKTSGWQRSELIILAARPSMGKTALAMNFVEHALLHQSQPVVVFSMEMPATSIIMRLLSSIGRIDQKRLHSGALEADEWDKLALAATRLKDKPLFIDDSAALTATEMRARLRRLQREHGEPALVMVDYLQLMKGDSREGRTAEISEISRQLKGMAREFNCPLMALSQLSRAVESRPNKRPMNSDLRDSGAIEQDADVILFIYRDDYYNPESPKQGTAELIIGKQRNGPTGHCDVAFLKTFTRFDNLARTTADQDG